MSQSIQRDKKHMKVRDQITLFTIIVLQAMLGKEWVDEFVSGQFVSRAPGTKLGFATYYSRTLSLAEMLFNFQNTEGFEDIIAQLIRPKPDIEAILAELETAWAIVCMGTPFKFVIPKGKFGDDYDGEIVFPNGELGCTETKCKVDTTALSAPTVDETLDKVGGSKLPKDRPGVAFLRIPQAWLSGSTLADEVNADWSKLLDERIDAFFERNRHVVMAEIFTIIVSIENNILRTTPDGRERANLKHHFDRGKNWSLMSGRPSALPDWWVSFLGLFMETTDGFMFTLPKDNAP